MVIGIVIAIGTIACIFGTRSCKKVVASPALVQVTRHELGRGVLTGHSVVPGLGRLAYDLLTFHKHRLEAFPHSSPNFYKDAHDASSSSCELLKTLDYNGRYPGLMGGRTKLNQNSSNSWISWAHLDQWDVPYTMKSDFLTHPPTLPMLSSSSEKTPSWGSRGIPQGRF